MKIRTEIQSDVPQPTELYVAEETGRMIEHAFLAPLFPSGGGQIAPFTKDVLVDQPAHGQGVGCASIRACAVEVKQRRAVRFELAVDHDNEGAARLYKQHGAVDTKKSYFRWGGQRLADLAKGQNDG